MNKESLTCENCVNRKTVEAETVEQAVSKKVTQCRACPPQVVGIGTQGGISMLSVYPTVDEHTPACALYAERPVKLVQ